MLHRAMPLILAAALCGLAAPALAQQKPATPAAPAPAAKPAEPQPVSAVPQSTTATFADWVLRCRRAEGTPEGPVSCEVAQTLQVQGQGPIAEIAFGRPPGVAGFKEPMRLVIVLPNNVSFPGTVAMAVDEKDTKPVELTYRRCLPAGCFADAEASADLLTRWRPQAERGRIAFKDGANRDVVLPFSFRGLSQALDAMAKQ